MRTPETAEELRELIVGQEREQKNLLQKFEAWVDRRRC